MPAPLENPIQAPMQLGPGETASSRADAQRQALDPGAIGQNLHDQAVASESETPQAVAPAGTDPLVAQTLQQTMATMADMQRQMAAMQTPVQPTTASEPTVPTLGVVDPAAADYTADERAQLGDLLPGAIDRRAQLAAQQMGNRALEMMQDSLDQRLQGMQTTLDQITQAQQQLTSQTKSQFEAGARASALRNGLDPQTANQDPVWNALMAEPANQITGETFNQHVAAIMARESSVELDRVFEIYAQRKAAANQGQPSVAPIPQGGGAHLGAPAPQGSEDIEGQIIELLQQKKALQQSRFSTDISAVSYNNQAAALQQQIQELQTRLYQPAAG